MDSGACGLAERFGRGDEEGHCDGGSGGGGSGTSADCGRESCRGCWDDFDGGSEGCGGCFRGDRVCVGDGGSGAVGGGGGYRVGSHCHCRGDRGCRAAL